MDSLQRGDSWRTRMPSSERYIGSFRREDVNKQRVGCHAEDHMRWQSCIRLRGFHLPTSQDRLALFVALGEPLIRGHRERCF